MSRPLCVVAAVALSTACVAPRPWWQEDLREWQGAPVSELLEAWGPPMRTLTGDDEATMLVYERARRLDPRLEDLRDPSARLDPDRNEPAYRPVEQSECTLYFEIADEHVASARHEGAACDIVPRDVARRHTDPLPGRRR